ncbi:major facilitator superfamily domain-containing protein [Stachybotrys elegans]|uniref:Major facilitator superfamily domain-containing protein n=1 Tax=Stachybotrys elegans TaxID=80388 RepID=A0A8K0SE16_9HYPO|nr:major facilitator superfamily domain-containing protein [Stachybotrys elegans]
MARFFRRGSPPDEESTRPGLPKWSMGVLNDPNTVQVPGSVLLLAAHRNQPLGLRNVHARTSHSSIPGGFPVQSPGSSHGHHGHSESSRPGTGDAAQPTSDAQDDQKKTQDGTIILNPQPEESGNDPLNWPSWRRDMALLSLGLYCMIGGGITPLIAAGFTDVAHEFDIHTETVALTTGLYMMGLGVGSVIMSPTAILFGKRPVYLASSILFIGTSLWAGWSPSFESLLAARVFQGIAVSPVECLPSATIAEIFFLHERAYRIGIYTLLLLGGKNLVPLVSAAIISRWGWRWTFWITAMVVGLGSVLLFFWVPETFWDRTPTRKPSKRPSFLRRLSSQHKQAAAPANNTDETEKQDAIDEDSSTGTVAEKQPETATEPAEPHHSKHAHVGFQDPDAATDPRYPQNAIEAREEAARATASSPSNQTATDRDPGYFPPTDNIESSASSITHMPSGLKYTHNLRQQPPKSFVQQLRPYHGRLNNDNWFKVMLRPFILFAYPAVLWSSVMYAMSVGWLIVISETMAIIYRDPETYNFTALQTGLVYVSPFIGGILGTGVAGKISDIIVKAMSARNGGLYEPEFRLIMALPILITTSMGLIGFGWSAQNNDHWIVPTVFFGVMSFGCSLGSTTSITFCVDSYRQYAGEALVTLNFSKNVLHGLVFSLFVTHWMADDGPRAVFIWIGIIQIIFTLFTIPMYIYGKRARMWTARSSFIEKF